jgi:hypothetical protein
LRLSFWLNITNGDTNMAKIVEDILIIKFSKIVKDSNTDPQPVINNEVIGALEQVAQELVGDNVVIEVLIDGN